MNVLARLGFELAYNDVTVQHVNLYITWTPPYLLNDPRISVILLIFTHGHTHTQNHTHMHTHTHTRNIAAKVYNAQLLDCARPEIKKIQNQNCLRIKQSTTSQILIIPPIIDGVHEKYLRQQNCSQIFPRHLIPYTEDDLV